VQTKIVGENKYFCNVFLRALATSMVVQSRNILLFAYGTCKQEQHEDDACTSEHIGNH